MDAVTLLKEARADGVSIEAIDGDLLIEATKDKKHWLETIRPHKQAILAHLNGGSPHDNHDDDLVPPITALPFPIHCLPDAIGDFIAAASKAIGCNPAFIALPILANLARAIGNSRVIRLRRTWTEPAIIWAAIVGKSGTHKTPALLAALKFIERREAKSITDFAQKQMDYQQALAQYERDIQAWKRSKSTEPPPWKPEEPVCVRYRTTDATVEAIFSLLAGQYDGLILVRDELAGWLTSFNQYKAGKGGDKGQWLSFWSAAPATMDRKTGDRRMIHVNRASVSLLGGIQPGVLRRAIAQEHMEEGLCARLLFCMPEPRRVIWSEATVHSDVEAAIGKVFDDLFALEPAADSEGTPEPFPLDLTAEAKSVWIEYFNRHRAELLDLDDDLAAAWSKLEAYAARFALIIQLSTDADSNAIDEVSMLAAIELADWFGNEAKRVYGIFVEDEEETARRELVGWIRRRGDACTVRELTHGCRRYRGKGLAEAALAELVRLNLGKWAPCSATGRGRPSNRFVLNQDNPVTVTQQRKTA